MSANTSKHISSVANLVEKAKGSCTEMRRLSSDFKPGKRDVICQRGKSAFLHNQFFRDMLEGYLSRYSNATSRLEKSLVVSDVVDAVRKGSPDGGFVRCVKDVYYEVGDGIAREKCGGTFREMLHTKYRSSAKAKRRMREQQKAAEQNAAVAQAPDSVPSLEVRRGSTSSVETAELVPESILSAINDDNNSLQEPSKKRRRVTVESENPNTRNALEDVLIDISSRRDELSSASKLIIEPTPILTISDCFEHLQSSEKVHSRELPIKFQSECGGLDEFDSLLSQIFPVEL